MSDVFISYAHEDRASAELLAQILQAKGWSVWWDRNIVAGQSFDQIIEHELDTAKAVIRKSLTLYENLLLKWPSRG